MYTTLLALHLVFAGVWLGCVLTEALFERALLGKGREQERILARLHKRVDLIVEIPAFTLVLLTGLWMAQGPAFTPLLHAKIGFGALAILTNLYCVWLVFKRAAAAEQDDWALFARLDHKQHLYGALVLVAILVALGLGITHLTPA